MRNHSKSITTVVLLICLLSQADTLAGIRTLRGNEVDFWPKYSVIFAEIIKVDKLPRDTSSDGTHRLHVKPKATLSGGFDPGLHPELELGIWIVPFDSTIIRIPTVGKHAVIVIRKHEKDYFVTSSIIAFMPKGAGLIEVESFSDPLVSKILSDIQSVRKNE